MEVEMEHRVRPIMRQFFAGTALAAILAWTGVAGAAPIGFIGGYSGPIQIKFQNYESFLSPTGGPATGLVPLDQNFGVVKVTSIVNPNTGAAVWFPGLTDGTFLSAVFNGIVVTTVTPAGGGGFDTTNTGGSFQLWQTSADFDPGQGTAGYTAAGCTVATLCYNGITNVGGTEILDFKLVPGTTADPTNTLSAHVSTLTLPTSGHAEGFANITGGPDAFQFGKGGFPTIFGPADLHFLDDFCGNGQSGCAGPTASDWQLFSHDPLDARIIPEPASLTLLGSALLSFALWAGCRNRKRG
jgi:hypothetical protein